MERGYYHRHHSSFFFPIMLITIGIVWLLVNNGTIATDNLYRLIPLWPVLLIGGGLSLLLRRVWWPLAALMWMLVAAGIIWALVAAPGILPTVNAASLRHETLSEPAETAKSAAVKLNLSVNPTTIQRSEEGDDLITADIYVAERAVLDVSGNEMKNVTLEDNSFEGVNFFNYAWITQANQPWKISLTPQIPLNLEIDASTGSLQMDLSGMKLEELDVNASTGSMTVVLPEDQAEFPFRLDASTGSVRIDVPENTSCALDMKASTGSITVDVPDDAGLQVEVTDGGTGSLNLPDGMEKVRGEEGEKEGLYENAAFKDAKNKVSIKLDMSTGSFNVR